MAYTSIGTQSLCIIWPPLLCRAVVTGARGAITPQYLHIYGYAAIVYNMATSLMQGCSYGGKGGNHPPHTPILSSCLQGSTLHQVADTHKYTQRRLDTRHSASFTWLISTTPWTPWSALRQRIPWTPWSALRSRQRTPWSALRQRTPWTALRQRTPWTPWSALRQRTPWSALRQRTPWSALRQRTPWTPGQH